MHLVEENGGLGLEILDGQLFPTVERAVGRHGHQQWLPVEDAHVHRLVTDRRARDRDVDPGLHDRIYQAFRQILVNGEPGLRPGALECADGRGEQVRRHRGYGAHRDSTPLGVDLAGEFLGDLPDCPEDEPRPGQKRRAGGRQGDRSSEAVEQPVAEFLLQLQDLLRQGGLGHVTAPGRTAEASDFGDGNEISQLVQFHPLSGRSRAAASDQGNSRRGRPGNSIHQTPAGPQSPRRLPVVVPGPGRGRTRGGTGAAIPGRRPFDRAGPGAILPGMTSETWVLAGERIVFPDGVRAGRVTVSAGRIVSVDTPGPAPAGSRVVDAGDAVVLPGLIDVHVHVNEPGRTEWEGFDSATRAAAAGGVTTIVDMPLNSIPAVTTVDALEAKRAAAAGKVHVDTGFWGGVVPGNARELEPLHAAGVLGFKCFLVDSGVPEFRNVTEADLREALPILSRLGAVLLVHAELPGPIERARPGPGSDPRRYTEYLASRPGAAEREAVDLMIALSREHDVHVHIVHLSCAGALAALRAARAAGVRVSVETCPQYLCAAAEEIADGATAFKCAPPIRSAANRELLWEALLAGEIDLVATDHSPSPPEMKHADSGDFMKAWGGIASLQLLLPLVWTEARARGAGYPFLARRLAEEPARLAGLTRKGRIAAGCDADLVLWDPDGSWTVDPRRLHHRHRLTPWTGRKLRGIVRDVYSRGRRVFGSEGLASAPAGALLSGRDR